MSADDTIHSSTQSVSLLKRDEWLHNHAEQLESLPESTADYVRQVLSECGIHEAEGVLDRQMAKGPLPTSLEQAYESPWIKDAIDLAIRHLIGLQRPAGTFRRLSDNSYSSRGRLDWQDLYGTVWFRLSDPEVGFATAKFNPGFAYILARNVAGEWLREKVKERPRKSHNSEENGDLTFQTSQFDPRFKKPAYDPEHPEDREDDASVGSSSRPEVEEAIDQVGRWNTYQTWNLVLDRFRRSRPKDHKWLLRYADNLRSGKHTDSDHSRARRLRLKLIALMREMDAVEEAECA